MKKSNPAVDSYAIGYINDIKDRSKTVTDPPWIDIKCDYDGLYRQAWIWVLVGHVQDVRKAYGALVDCLRILDLDERRCELNLMFMCRVADGRMGHIADLCGKQDVIDFDRREIDESEIIVGAVSEANLFSS
jgi:hypothetical protein